MIYSVDWNGYGSNGRQQAIIRWMRWERLSFVPTATTRTAAIATIAAAADAAALKGNFLNE